MNPISNMLVLDFCDWLASQIRLNTHYENGIELLFSDNNLEIYAEEYLRQNSSRNIKDLLIQFIQSPEFDHVMKQRERNSLFSHRYNHPDHLIEDLFYDFRNRDSEFYDAFWDFYRHNNPSKFSARDLAHYTTWLLENGESRITMSLMTNLEESISLELGFLGWLSGKRIKNSLFAIPSEVFEHLVDEFVAERGKGIQEKRKLMRVYERTGWARFIDKTRFILRKHQPKNFQYIMERYCSHSAKFNCVILPLSDPESQSQFRKLISDYWDNLNDLSGDILDIYYSESDLNKTGYDIAERLSALPLELKKKAPCIIIWERNIKEAKSVSIDELSHKQIFAVIKEIVQTIYYAENSNDNNGITLEELISNARNIADQKRAENHPGIHIINRGKWHQKGDIVGGNKNGGT